MYRFNYEEYFTENFERTTKNVISTHCSVGGFHAFEASKQKCLDTIYEMIRHVRGFALFLTKESQTFGECATLIRGVMSQYIAAYDLLAKATTLEELADTLNKAIKLNSEFCKLYLEDSFFHSSEYSDYRFNDREWKIFLRSVAEHFKYSNNNVKIFNPFYAESINSNSTNVNRETLINNDEDNNLFSTINCEMYGVDVEAYPIERYTKFLNSPLKSCTIGLRAFDAVVGWWETAFMPGQNPSIIKRMANYVKQNGAVVLYGNIENANSSNLRRISSLLTDIHVYCNTTDVTTYGYNGYFVLIGRRKVNDEFNADTYAQLLNVFVHLREQQINQDFTFIGSNEPIAVFKTDSIESVDFETTFDKISDFTSRNSTKILSSRLKFDERRPLLPFSSGQLGLILVSGSIDGKIQENDKIAHVVKGYPYRTREHSSEDIYNTAHEVIGSKNIFTYYNASAVTVITADGQIKELR